MRDPEASPGMPKQSLLRCRPTPTSPSAALRGRLLSTASLLADQDMGPGVRKLLHDLIKILDESREPCLLAASVMTQLLTEAEELHQEVGGLVADMVTLGRLDKAPLPAVELAGIRRDVDELIRLRELLDLDRLLSVGTPRQCSGFAVPDLAFVLFQVSSRLEVFYAWLESVDQCRIAVDARLHHLLSDRRCSDRYP